MPKQVAAHERQSPVYFFSGGTCVHFSCDAVRARSKGTVVKITIQKFTNLQKHVLYLNLWCIELDYLCEKTKTVH